MDLKRTVILCLFLALTFLSSQAKECEADKYDRDIFYRILILRGEGGVHRLNATRSEMALQYGDCNVDQHVLKVIDTYESYGFNLSDVRRDPFQFHSGDNYEFLLGTSTGFLRLVMASIFDLTSFENSILHNGWWALKATRDVVGPKGLISQNSYLYAGIWRITMHNREFCLFYTPDSPSIEGPDGIAPVDLMVESPEWGSGRSGGMYKLLPDFSYEETEIITFPANLI